MNSNPAITILGARQHNLKDIDLEIPTGKITVITGRSGSGKSTLAIDILFAEGQHIYLQSLGAENLAGKRLWTRPDVDSILHLPPPIALQQSGTLSIKNPNSTIATFTGLKRLARMLFATAATVRCPECHIPLHAHSIDAITAKLELLDQGTRIILLAPVTSIFRQMPPDEAAAMLQGQGFLRIKIDNKQFYTDQPLEMPDNWNRAEIIIDRLIIKPGISARLHDSVRLALKAGNGVLTAEIINKSGNTQGNGSGSNASRLTFTESLACPQCSRRFPHLSPQLFSVADMQGQGSPVLPEGLSSVEEAREFINSVNLHGLSWLEFFNTDFRTLGDWIDELVSALNRPDEISFETRHRVAAQRIADAISETIKYACDMGISYLTPGLSLTTLSHGELQRLRLGEQLGKSMSGILYILDEPTAGLHPSEHASLLRHIKRLQQMGNTILVIEHDTAMIEHADHVIELGPGAGEEGGRVIFAGSPVELAAYSGYSITSPWFSGKKDIVRRPIRHNGAEWIKIDFTSHHNLQEDTLKFPRQSLTCLTGLSGSGKTALLEAIINRLVNKTGDTSGCNNLPGTVLVDQNAVNRTSVSFPATYMKIFPHIRGLFARTPEARKRGLTAGWFSLSKKGGRCEYCRGRGTVTSDLSFLPPVSSKCEICGGRRYNRDAMTIHYRDHSISDVLDMSVTEAIGFFMHIRSVREPLEWMERTGLGYIRLGQDISTMSGGELQRLKLASELSRHTKTETLYLFDEPTRGLHLEDVSMLMTIIDDLLERGNSVIIAEHEPRIMAVSDWIIELGPGRGPEGGRITFQGTPAELASHDSSPTAPFIRKFMQTKSPA